MLLIKNEESIAGDAKLFAMAAPCVRGDILALLPYAIFDLLPLLLLFSFVTVGVFIIILSAVAAGVESSSGVLTRFLLFTGVKAKLGLPNESCSSNRPRLMERRLEGDSAVLFFSLLLLLLVELLGERLGERLVGGLALAGVGLMIRSELKQQQ